jgi:prefoldin subunit 5
MNIQLTEGLDVFRLFEIIFIPFGTIYVQQLIKKIDTILSLKADCEACRKSWHDASEYLNKSVDENRKDHKDMCEKINTNSDHLTRIDQEVKDLKK